MVNVGKSCGKGERLAQAGKFFVPKAKSWDKAGGRRKKEATMGFEPMMRVLQTLALPLGHVA